MAKYVVSEVAGSKVVTAFINGELLTAADSNPMFNTIVERLFEDDTEGLEELFTAEVAVARRFKQLSERVSVSAGNVFFDGDAIDNVLSEHLLRLIRSGEDVSYLVNFWEKIAQNPSEHSRENMLRWLRTHDFSITVEGDIVAYKGLTAEGTSIHSGPGVVDGVQMNGHLPNKVGSVVSIGRRDVTADPSLGCAFGLHAGTWDYASTFGHGLTVEVIINPRDVVSVPTDCADAKMRVSRYRVAKVITAPRTAAVVNYDNDWDAEDGYGEDYDY